jgi:hypothetical protein
LKAFLLDTTHDIEIDDENAVFYKVYFVSWPRGKSNKRWIKGGYVLWKMKNWNFGGKILYMMLIIIVNTIYSPQMVEA